MKLSPGAIVALRSGAMGMGDLGDLGELGSIFSKIGGALSGAVKGVGKGITGAVGLATKAVLLPGQLAVGLVKGGVGLVGGTVKTLAQGVGGMASGIGGAAGGLVRNVGEGAGSIIGGVAAVPRGIVGGVGGGLLGGGRNIASGAAGGLGAGFGRPDNPEISLSPGGQPQAINQALTSSAPVSDDGSGGGGSYGGASSEPAPLAMEASEYAPPEGGDEAGGEAAMGDADIYLQALGDAGVATDDIADMSGFMDELKSLGGAVAKGAGAVGLSYIAGKLLPAPQQVQYRPPPAPEGMSMQTKLMLGGAGAVGLYLLMQHRK